MTRSWIQGSLILIGLSGSGVLAQSDPAGFAVVIHVPPVEIGDFAALDKNTQINLFDGHAFSFDFNASNPAGNPRADVFYGTAVGTVTRMSGDEPPSEPDDDRIFSSRFQQLPEPLLSQM